MKQWIPAAVVITIGVAAAAVAFFRPGGVDHIQVRVPGASMESTIPAGATVTLAKVAGDHVHRGDIVVFAATAWPDSGVPAGLLAKRVIGIGGDTVQADDHGHISVNGRPINENYVKRVGPIPGSTIDFRVKVDTGQVFVAGDWRGNSRDSRLYVGEPGHGGIPVKDIRGIVVAINGTAITATTAFTAAGLDGTPYQETSSSGPTRTLIIAGGFTVFLGGLIWFILALARRNRATS